MKETVNTQRTVYESLLNQITDIGYQLSEEANPTGANMRGIPLGEGKKYPLIKDYYNKSFSPEQLAAHKGNIGFVIGSELNDTDYTFACIDIDGVSVPNVDDEKKAYYKKETAKFIFESLKALHNTIIVETQSGNNHLYYWTRKRDKKPHRISNSLNLPADFHIKELQGKNLGNAIEIFTEPNSKFVVAPGSYVIGDNGEKRCYKVISENHNIAPHNSVGTMQVEDLNESVKDALIEQGFTYQEKESKTYDLVTQETTYTKLRKLSDADIDEVVEILTPYFELLVGQKHNSYLALGGYFCKFLEKETTIKIVEKLLETTHDYQENSNEIYTLHIQTALKNYDRNSENHTGLPTLLENIQGAKDDLTKNELDGFKFKLQKIVNPHFKWNILVENNGFQGERYLILDYGKSQIWTKTIKTTKEGKKYCTKQFAITDFIPVSISRKINLLEPNEPYIFSFKYKVNHENKVREINLDDSTLLTQELKRNIGLVLKGNYFRDVIDEVMGEFSRLGISETIENIPIRGVFLHPDTGELIRSEKEGIVKIEKPSIEDVKEGVKVWRKLEEVYPYDLSKLSSILRWGLVAPFSYIKKTKYQMIPMLFLYGASRTSKTTLAEISLSPYTDIDEEVSLGGSAADTLYRMETALKRQGISVIINEPGRIIQESNELIDLLKSATESKYSREKMDKNGIHSKRAAYANIVFTANNLMPNDDALIRRIRFIEFFASERLTEEDMRNFNNAFHYVNKLNNDFTKLRAVGDYVIWYVSQNTNLLGMPEATGELATELLNAIFDYAGEERINFLYTQTSYMDIKQGDNNTLDNIRNMINSDLNRWIMNPSKIQQEVDKNGIYTDAEVLTSLKDRKAGDQAINENIKQSTLMTIQYKLINYLRVKNNKDGEKEVVITPSISKSLERFCGDSKSGKNIADIMGFEYKTLKMSDGSTTKGFCLTYDEFRLFLG